MMDAMVPYYGEQSPAAQAGAVVAGGGRMLQTQSKYSTAVSCAIPRELPDVQRRLMQEADLAGDRFYYGWGSGKDKIEGASIKLALAAVRCYGNVAVEMGDVQEIDGAWVFTASVIDLETGYTLSRQFRQSKKSTIYGKHDEERKDDMRFQIGQSKAIRNVVLNFLPVGLVDTAMSRAKKAVRGSLEGYIKQNGKVAATDVLIKDLGKSGVTPEDVCRKFDVASVDGLTIDDLVIIRGDVAAIHQGQERAENLYPKKKELSIKDPATVEPDRPMKPGDVAKSTESPTVEPEPEEDNSAVETGTEPQETPREPQSDNPDTDEPPHTVESIPWVDSKLKLKKVRSEVERDTRISDEDRVKILAACDRRLIEITAGRKS